MSTPARSSGNGSSGNGFALTEVLVAFVIVGFSLMIVFQIIGRNARAQSLVGDYEQALYLGEQLLAVVPEWGDSSGFHGNYSWQLKVAPVELIDNSGGWAGSSKSGPNTQLANVTVTIHWDNGARDLTLKTRRILSDDHPAP